MAFAPVGLELESEAERGHSEEELRLALAASRRKPHDSPGPILS